MLRPTSDAVAAHFVVGSADFAEPEPEVVIVAAAGPVAAAAAADGLPARMLSDCSASAVVVVGFEARTNVVACSEWPAACFVGLDQAFLTAEELVAGSAAEAAAVLDFVVAVEVDFVVSLHFSSSPDASSVP